MNGLDPEDGACLCETGCCKPRENAGRKCWLSDYWIRPWEFDEHPPVPQRGEEQAP